MRGRDDNRVGKHTMTEKYRSRQACCGVESGANTTHREKHRESRVVRWSKRFQIAHLRLLGFDLINGKEREKPDGG